MIYVVHHTDADGYGSAWAAWEKLTVKDGGFVTYIPRDYNDDHTEFLKSLKKEDSVYVMDVNFPLDVFEEILKITEGKLTFIDHHVTVRKQLGEKPWYIYDETKSGCVLSWEYFHPGKEVPKILQHVQDWDLWKFTMKESKLVYPITEVNKKDFFWWRGVSMLNAENFLGVIDQGGTMLEYHDHVVNLLVSNAWLAEFEGYKVAVVNATYPYCSDVGNLLRDFPEVDFAMTFWTNSKGERVWSLRSKGEMDVSKIAFKLGGGGHKYSAGMTLPADVMPKFLKKLDADS